MWLMNYYFYIDWVIRLSTILNKKIKIKLLLLILLFYKLIFDYYYNI